MRDEGIIDMRALQRIRNVGVGYGLLRDQEPFCVGKQVAVQRTAEVANMHGAVGYVQLPVWISCNFTARTPQPGVIGGIGWRRGNVVKIDLEFIECVVRCTLAAGKSDASNDATGCIRSRRGRGLTREKPGEYAESAYSNHGE